jgi:hypothetical protein
VGAPPVRAQGRKPPQEAPAVGSVTSMYEPFTWGMNHQQVVEVHNKVGGLFDKDYDPILARLQPGVQQKAIEADRDNRKHAFENSYTEFRVPTGYDSTAIAGEFTYGNNESLLVAERGGKKRYFFFIGAKPSERLWKIYDEIPLAENGALGKTFNEAVVKLQANMNAPPGRAHNPDANYAYTTVEWQDDKTHVRILDRSGSHAVSVVLEERSTLANLPMLRARKAEDPFALDPSIRAVTKGTVSDPNSNAPQPTKKVDTK